MGSVIKKRRKRMSKKKHRKLLRKTRVQRRKLGGRSLSRSASTGASAHVARRTVPAQRRED